jgi:hypothetical protein
MPSPADSTSITLDDVTYCYSASTAAVLRHGRKQLCMPRGLVSVDGDILPVNEVQYDRNASRESDVLKGICIPSSITKICQACFLGCRSLLTFAFEFDCNLSSIEDSALRNCSSLLSICIPSSVERIGDSCFGGCHAFSTVTFEPDSNLSCMQYSAFHNCSHMLTICIPASVTTIGAACFSECGRLLTVSFGSDSELSCLGNAVFWDCSSLSSFCVPAFVEELSCFSGCGSLSKIVFEAG